MTDIMIGGGSEMTQEEMLEEARRRERENSEKQRRKLSELPPDERIDLAIEELGWVALGGQDGEEWMSSMTFILNVLKSLRSSLPHTTLQESHD